MRSLFALLRPFASRAFILTCLALMMILVIIGTLAQKEIGAFAAQRIYFNSFLVMQEIGGVRVPVFPGGLTIGLLWLISLIAASILHIRWTKKNTGLILSHLGIILMILGQGITQMIAEESMMSIEEGQTKNYSELSRDVELVFVDTSNPEYNQVTSIPVARLVPGEIVSDANLPFSVAVKSFYQNSGLKMNPGGTGAATQGIGPQIAVTALKPTQKDGESNVPAAIIELKDSQKSLGSWLVSTGLEAPQSFAAGGKTYEVYLRLKRRYFPFSLTLAEFSHDIYPGTDIPKNFSSLVRVNYPEKSEMRDALIYMNHPLRFEGYTFYQASFGKEDTLSVLQVVENPAWLTPYISCIIVTVGLLVQFLGHLFKRTRRAI